jgi:hypothetical protein
MEVLSALQRGTLCAISRNDELTSHLDMSGMTQNISSLEHFHQDEDPEPSSSSFSSNETCDMIWLYLRITEDFCHKGLPRTQFYLERVVLQSQISN